MSIGVQSLRLGRVTHATHAVTRRLARTAAVLLTATAALFVVGVIAEANRTIHSESSETHTETGSESGDVTGSATAEAAHGEATETVFGIDIESPATATVAVIASLALAAGLWLTQRRGVALAAAVFAVLFAAFDMAEIVHQIDESRTGLAVLAAAIALGHAAAAVTAGYSTTMSAPASD